MAVWRSACTNNVMFRNVIFDLDGTLLNTLDDLADAGNHTCRVMGWPEHPVQAYRYFVGNGIPKLVERFTPGPYRTPETLKAALDIFVPYYNAHKEDKTVPYAGMPETLARLREAGVRMAVLTNKAHPLAKAVVEQYFPQMFPLVQGALPDRPTKPDPELLHQLMEEMGAKPEDTLFVGDSNVDVRTAKNGGLKCCGVLWGFRTEEELAEEGADYIVRTPADLEKLILR